MSEKQNKTSMSVKPETLATFRELSDRVSIDLMKLLSEMAVEIQKVLDEMPEDARLVYMPQAVPEKKIVLLRFNSLSVVCGAMPEAKDA